MITSPRPQKPPRAGLAQAVVLTLATFLPIMAIVSLAPAVPILFGRFHADPAAPILIPLMITAPGLLIAILSPVAGVLIDFVGRRRILLIALFVYAVAGLSPFVLDDLRQILVSRFVLGAAEAILMTAGNTLIGDYFEGAARRKWLAFQGGVGAVLGTTIWASSGFLAELGWRWPFAVYTIAVPVFLAALFVIHEPLRRAPETIEPQPAEKPKFPYGEMAWACVVTLFTTTVYYAYTLNVGLVFTAMGVKAPSVIGLITALASVAVPVSTYLYNRISGIRTSWLLALMFLFLGLGLAGLGVVRDLRWGAVSAVAEQFGAGMTIPILIAWVQRRLPFEHRGRGMGIWVTCFFIGQFTCPLSINAASGWVGGIQGVFVLFGILTLAAAGLSLLAGLVLRDRKPAGAPDLASA